MYETKVATEFFRPIQEFWLSRKSYHFLTLLSLMPHETAPVIPCSRSAPYRSVECIPISSLLGYQSSNILDPPCAILTVSKMRPVPFLAFSSVVLNINSCPKLAPQFALHMVGWDPPLMSSTPPSSRGSANEHLQRVSVEFTGIPVSNITSASKVPYSISSNSLSK